MVPVVHCQLEAGFKQPPRDRPAHIADPDKSKPTVFLRDWFHDEAPLGQPAISISTSALIEGTRCTVSRREPNIHARYWRQGGYGVKQGGFNPQLSGVICRIPWTLSVCWMALVLTQLVVESRVAQMRVSAGIAPRIFKRKPDSRRIHLSAVDRVERSTISFKNYSAVLPIALLSITIRQRNAQGHESGRRGNQPTDPLSYRPRHFLGSTPDESRANRAALRTAGRGS